jgi:hypothetical protein
MSPSVALLVALGTIGSSSAAERGSMPQPFVGISVADLVSAIDNDDIEWAVQHYGVMPIRVRRASLLVYTHCNHDFVTSLVGALDDPKRCASAHYLLGVLMSVRILTSDRYDGLQFDRQMKPIVDAGTRRTLKELWKRRAATWTLIEAFPAFLKSAVFGARRQK